MLKKTIITIVVVLSVGLKIHGYQNQTISTGNEPGNIYFTMKLDYNDMHTPIYISDNYGEDYHQIRYTGGPIEFCYQNQMLTFVAEDGYAYTFDNCNLYDYFEYPIRNGFEFFRQGEEIVAHDELRRYSYDTLRTWIRGERHNNGENGTTTSNLSSLGWEPETHLYMLGFTDDQGVYDSVGIYYARSLVDSFLAVDHTTLFDAGGQLFTGYAPGELYFYNFNSDSLFMTADTGHTWEVVCKKPFPRENLITTEIEAGWQPGELFWFDNSITFHDQETYLLYSDDFGVTWDFKVGSPPENSVSVHKILNKEFELSIWPNPSNNYFNIEGDLSLIDKILITNLSGRQIELKNFYRLEGSFSRSLDFSNIPSGTYYITLYQNSTMVIARRIVLLK
ncbi:T9SS type A sorting domain-containing protein [bacterium]|nr:T9SS type A sorting domain-containing protein [bacterium]